MGKKKTLRPVQQHLFKILFKGYYRDKYTSFFNCFLTICTVWVLSIHILVCVSLMFCCHTNRCKLKTICGAQCIEKVHFSKGLDNWSGVCYVKSVREQDILRTSEVMVFGAAMFDGASGMLDTLCTLIALHRCCRNPNISLSAHLFLHTSERTEG